MSVQVQPLGDQLRAWRQRRRLSQLDLALDTDISTRHLSFVETGRARPSRAMVLRLAEQLEVPLRGRNAMLLAAGYAPAFPEHALDDPAMVAARRAIDILLTSYQPYPALAVDRHWTLVAANAAVTGLIAGCAPALLAPPINVLRLSLHPGGLAPRIVNFGEWRWHILDRLRRQVEASADATLAALLDELRGYSGPETSGDAHAGVLLPLTLRSGDETLSFVSTTTIFGTPVDVTLSELAIETFLPADEATAMALRVG